MPAAGSTDQEAAAVHLHKPTAPLERGGCSGYFHAARLSRVSRDPASPKKEAMKLVRFGPRGREKPGIVDVNGGIRDASGVVEDITPATIAAGALAQLKRVKPDALPPVRKGARLGPPVGGVRQFLGIGLNYADHAAETGAQVPKEPIVFSKHPSCIVGPNDDVTIPKDSQKTDWEVELAFVIGRGGAYIEESDALAHVAGYMICNDVSERSYQYDRGGQWIKGKSSPGFGPIRPGSSAT